MTTLLPCPFCGKDAEVHAKLSGLYVAGCDDEGCPGCWLGAPQGGRVEVAMSLWNTRYHFGLTDEDYNILLDEMGIAKPERIAHWQPTFIDGKPAATCSLCGAVEWDYDMDEPWEYCHGCGSRMVKE